VAGLTACGKSTPTPEPTPGPPQEETAVILTLSSSAFKDGGNIPTKYTCDGGNVSPALTWGEPPVETQSFVLIMDNLVISRAAVGQTHWVLFNIPSNTRELPEDIARHIDVVSGASQGKNDFGRIGYQGPCPKPGVSYQYCFTLYALDQLLPPEVGAKSKQILDAAHGHILAQGELTGIYQR